MSSYLAMVLHLIHERYKIKGEDSVWKPYIDILPETSGVNPTCMWNDDCEISQPVSPRSFFFRPLEMGILHFVFPAPFVCAALGAGGTAGVGPLRRSDEPLALFPGLH